MYHPTSYVFVAFFMFVSLVNARYPIIHRTPGGSLFEFQFHPIESSPAPNGFAYSNYAQQMQSAPMEMSASNQKLALSAEVFRSMLDQVQSNPNSYLTLPLATAAAEHQPIAISIPIKANQPRKFHKLRLDTNEEVIYGTRAPSTSVTPAIALATSPNSARRLRVSAVRMPTQSASEMNVQRQTPTLVLVQTAQASASSRQPRFQSNQWLPVDNSRPRGVVVSQHNVQLVPPNRDLTPVASKPSTSAHMTHPSEADSFRRPYSKLGFHEIEPPKLADARPAHIPAPTPDLPRPKIEHPAFTQPRNTDGFKPMTSQPKPRQTPPEPLDYGTDIITIYDVDKMKNKQQPLDPDTFLKSVTSTLQVKANPKVQRGKVFDDVIYDYPGEDQDFKPTASERKPMYTYKPNDRTQLKRPNVRPWDI